MQSWSKTYSEQCDIKKDAGTSHLVYCFAKY